MIQRSLEVRRYSESRRLIKSTGVILLVVSLAILLLTLVLIRAIASASLPEAVSEVVYDSYWLCLACMIVKTVWSDFTGRGLLLTFKKTGAYLQTILICNWLVTLPIVCLNVFLVPKLVAQSSFMWYTCPVVRTWQGYLVGASLQLLTEIWLLRGNDIQSISDQHYSN